jgi:hypothetical protein
MTMDETQTGPWWSRILTNRSAVIALFALYLLYYVTGMFDTRLQDLSQVEVRMEAAIAEHEERRRVADDHNTDLNVRLIDQLVINNRLQREICWSTAKSDTQRRKCYDPDVK